MKKGTSVNAKSKPVRTVSATVRQQQSGNRRKASPVSANTKGSQASTKPVVQRSIDRPKLNRNAIAANNRATVASTAVKRNRSSASKRAKGSSALWTVLVTTFAMGLLLQMIQHNFHETLAFYVGGIIVAFGILWAAYND